MIAPAVDRRFSEGSKMMNEQEKDLEKAEQELFETIISMILYLNKNGIRLDAVREMIQMKVDYAFSQYQGGRFSELFDKYYVSTSAISQTIVRIIAKSTPYYSDKQKCDQKMHWLRDKVFETKEKNNLETRYTFSKKEYPTRKKYIILINDKLMQWDTQVHFFCERSPSNTAYNARLNVWNQTLSSRLSEEWDEFRKQKINTKGFE